MIYTATALVGKSFLVTGGSSGIGRETGMALSKAGARVALIGRDASRLQSALEKLAPEGNAAFNFDLSQLEEIPSFLKRVASEFGPLDGLVHCAGIEQIKPVSLIKENAIDEVFRVAVSAAMVLTRAFMQPGIRSVAQGAASTGSTSLVFMSSVAAFRGQAGMTVYGAAKSAVEGMVRGLAVELAPKSVRVNSIVAGAIATEMHDRMMKNLPPEAIKTYEDRHLLGFGRSSDIANAAVFLCSDASRWITGTGLVVDGGYTAK